MNFFPLIAFIWWSATIFIGGICFGAYCAGKRYARAVQDRDAEAKREAKRVAGFMIQGVEFNNSILAILRAQGQMPRHVTVDWTLLTHAANGAGLALVRAKPVAEEKVH